MPRGAKGTVAHRAPLLPIGPEEAPTSPGRVVPSAAALLADADRDLDRRALEAELLAQPPLDEAAVAGLDEARGEDHEPRRPGRGLRREEDARLLAATQGVRVRGHDLAEEGVEAR